MVDLPVLIPCHDLHRWFDDVTESASIALNEEIVAGVRVANLNLNTTGETLLPVTVFAKLHIRLHRSASMCNVLAQVELVGRRCSKLLLNCKKNTEVIRESVKEDGDCVFVRRLSSHMVLDYLIKSM